MGTYLNFAQILVSVTLIVLILMQARGSGLGAVFGQDSSGFQTRRGMEKTLFYFTIAFSVLFFIISILSVVQPG